jgi:hypothetical protein
MAGDDGEMWHGEAAVEPQDLAAAEATLAALHVGACTSGSVVALWRAALPHQEQRIGRAWWAWFVQQLVG